jgi:DNA primase catalytic core
MTDPEDPAQAAGASLTQTVAVAATAAELLASSSARRAQDRADTADRQAAGLRSQARAGSAAGRLAFDACGDPMPSATAVLAARRSRVGSRRQAGTSSTATSSTAMSWAVPIRCRRPRRPRPPPSDPPPGARAARPACRPPRWRQRGPWPLLRARPRSGERATRRGAGPDPGPAVVLEAAQRFYASQLAGAPDVQGYLDRRGLPPELATRLGFGYAPGRWTGLLESLRRSGVRDDETVAAGLAMRTSRPGVVDRLRSRVVLPVRDETGRLVGFTGRAAPGSSPNAPKYLDTLARGVKSRTLHGLADGRRLLERGATPVLCEGPFDAHAVTRLTRGGYVGLAPGGTHLSADHLAALGSVAPLGGRRVVVAFDADRAGQRATHAVYGLLRQVGAVPDAAVLPAGLDPAELGTASPTRLVRALNTAGPLEDLLVDSRLAAWAPHLRWAEGTAGALTDLGQLLTTVPPDRVARQVTRVARHLAVNPAVITGVLVNALDQPAVASPRPPPPAAARR